jgi:hypothetical protein
MRKSVAQQRAFYDDISSVTGNVKTYRRVINGDVINALSKYGST